MFVYEIIPISRSRFAADTLSYFSTKELKIGDLVEVALRGKIVPGIVSDARDAKELKSEIKRTSFKLKPVKKIIVPGFYQNSDFEILEKLSAEMLIYKSAILYEMIPKALLSSKFIRPNAPNRTNIPKYHSKIALSGSFDDRIGYFKTLIREHFARSQSLMIISPRIQIVNRFEEELGRGISDYVFTFTGALSSKKYFDFFQKALELQHPVLIIGTPQILCFSRPDLETVILEDEASALYENFEHVRFNFKKAAEIITEVKKNKLILSGEVLKVETVWKAEQREIESRGRPLFRIQGGPQTELIKIPDKIDKNNLTWFLDKLSPDLEEAIFKKERVLLFINRRGYSSFTVCGDCGKNLICPNCSVPLVLHAKKDQHKNFVCHHCLQTLPLPSSCPDCGSWNLRDFGIGIEKVESALKKLFPKVNIARIDGDASKGLPKNKKSRDNQNFKEGAFVLATELIFSDPDSKFDLTCIVTLDHLFTLPDFRMNEKIFRLITELKSRTIKKMILQTRLDEGDLLEDALQGNISNFYRRELEERRTLFYPPFSRLIKLSLEGNNLIQIKQSAQKVLETLRAYDPLSFPAFLEKIKGRHRWNILIKTAPGEFSKDLNLRAILKNLRGVWDIAVDPESII
ncbi:primosomal protein N' [Candidatus Giovannonibacteria bacterium]|nr:primosomal protein N' [Candidatus Giovannonibacteria bacterium]